MTAVAVGRGSNDGTPFGPQQMSSLSVQPFGAGSPVAALRFGIPGAAGEGSVQWLLRRNCSMTPLQLIAFYLSLCALALAIAAAFWWRGASLIMPFASVELLAVGAALFVYARHAADSETIRLLPGRLTVRRVNGLHVEQVEFAPAWVRVEPAHGDRSLIEISGEGKRVAIGRFVRPELRRALADELRAALRRSGAAADAA